MQIQTGNPLNESESKRKEARYSRCCVISESGKFV